MQNILDKNLKKECIKLLKINENEPKICLNLHIIDEEQTKTKMPFLATNNGIYIFGNGKLLALKAHFGYEEITELKLIDQSSFKISVKNKSVTIVYENSPLVISMLVSVINSVLPERERPQITYDPTLVGEIKQAHQVYLSRLQYLIHRSGNRIPIEFIKKLSQKIDDQTTKIDFTPYSEAPRYLDFLLESLQIQPRIKSVKLPKSRENNWKSISNCIKTNTTLEHLETHEVIDKSFQIFTDALCSNENSKLKSISLVSPNIGPKEFPLVRKLFTTGKIRSFTLANEDGKYFSSLVEELAKEKGFSKIEKVKLIELKGFSGKGLFEALPNIKDIFVKECGVDVTDLLPRFPKTLRSIEIKGGTASPGLSDFEIPNILTDIVLNDIQWSADSFASVVSKLLSHSPDGDFRLDLSCARLSNEGWQKVIETVKILKPSQTLTKLIWDNNPSNASLLAILPLFPKLKCLSFNGCLFPEISLSFCEAVKSIEHLNTLKVGGGESCLKEKSVALIKGLRYCTNIDRLYIDNQKFGPVGFLELSDLLNINKNIKFVSCRNERINNKDLWIKFLENLVTRGPPLEIKYPTEDFEEMRRERTMLDEDIEHICDLMFNIKNGSLQGAMNEEELEELNVFGAATDSSEIIVNNGPDLDWTLSLPSIPLPDISSQTGELMDRFSFFNVIRNLHSS